MGFLQWNVQLRTTNAFIKSDVRFLTDLCSQTSLTLIWVSLSIKPAETSCFWCHLSISAVYTETHWAVISASTTHMISHSASLSPLVYFLKHSYCLPFFFWLYHVKSHSPFEGDQRAAGVRLLRCFYCWIWLSAHKHCNLIELALSPVCQPVALGWQPPPWLVILN